MLLPSARGISTATKDKLKACSSGTDYYAEATSSADLVAFFNHIGEDVINKSIYVCEVIAFTGFGEGRDRIGSCLFLLGCGRTGKPPF